MRGYIYGFFPVEVDEEQMTCDAVDSWQWNYFEWVFCGIAFIFSLFGIDGFPIKIKE